MDSSFIWISYIVEIQKNIVPSMHRCCRVEQDSCIVVGFKWCNSVPNWWFPRIWNPNEKLLYHQFLMWLFWCFPCLETLRVLARKMHSCLYLKKRNWWWMMKWEKNTTKIEIFQSWEQSLGKSFRQLFNLSIGQGSIYG